MVISQSMYFPWVGLLEQIRIADVFVHYDDVQFSKGGFTNRVQIKTEKGSRWMTVPMKGLRLGQAINEVTLDESRDWRAEHQEMLFEAYQGAAFRDEMLSLVQRVHERQTRNLADLAKASIIELATYFGLCETTRFVDIEDLGILGASSQRVHDTVKILDGDKYVTGHGARHYLDHQLLEKSSIAVEYMAYKCIPYRQLHGAFTPYVTALDLVANCGKDGKSIIRSESIGWKEFLKGK